MTSRLASELWEITEDYWRTRGRPILLSALGERLSPDARAEKDTLGTTLAAFIRNHLADRIRFVTLPPHGGGVAPKELTAGLADAELKARVPPPVVKLASVARERSPIIDSDLWQTFRHKLPEGSKVYVDLPARGKLTIRTIAEGEEGETGWLPIEADDLPEIERGDETRNPAAIGAAIRAWARKNNVPFDRIEQPRLPAQLGQFPIAHPQTRSGSLALLAEGLSVLTAEELSRLMLPADIVVNLIRRSLVG